MPAPRWPATCSYCVTLESFHQNYSNLPFTLATNIHEILHDFSGWKKPLVPHGYHWASQVRIHTVRKYSLSESTLISFQQRNCQRQSMGFLTKLHNFSCYGWLGIFFFQNPFLKGNEIKKKKTEGKYSSWKINSHLFFTQRLEMSKS